MRILKLICIVVSFVIFLIVCSILHILITLICPSIRWHVMSQLTYRLIRFLRTLLGIKIAYQGNIQFLKEKEQFIICRHIGYIDGIVLGSLFPTVFVSKKEIKNWPLIGKVVQISGTIFVDRQHKSEVCKCLRAITDRLKRKINVLIFPEGTSTDGTQVLPFQSPFFGVPINTQSPILPVTINYQKLDGKDITLQNRDEICWYSKMDFAKHLWNLMRYKRIEVAVTLHDKITTGTYQNTSADRKKLAQWCHQTIAGYAGNIAYSMVGIP